MIPLCVPEIRGNEWRYIKDCLDTGWISSVGSYVDRFEQMVADRVGAAHGVAAVNGTSALHIALQIAGVERDDEVLVSSLTFIAPANAIRYIGAWPVLVDAEPDYWQWDSTLARAFLENECRFENGELRNKTSGRRVKALLPVHVLGHPVDLAPLLELARSYGLRIVEDATESLGATYRGEPVGHLADIACFSFNGNKLLTTGGGGMIVTDDEAWARRAKYLTTQAKDDPVEYVHHEVGYNYRLTNVLAAMGCAQMEMLDEYVAAKRQIAAGYRQALKDVPGLTLMGEADWATSSFWMYTVLIDEVGFGLLFAALCSRNCKNETFKRARCGSRSTFPPRTQGHRSCGMECPDRLYRDALSLPCSVGLRQDQQDRVIEAISEIRTGQARR